MTASNRQQSLFPDDPTTSERLAGVRVQLESALQTLGRELDDIVAAMERDEPRRVEARDLQEFFADVVDLALTSTDLGVAARLIGSLEDAGCLDAEALRARFIRGLASRDDISYKRWRTVADDLDFDDDESIARGAPELAEVLARAAVLEGKTEILEAMWAEDVDWSECDRAALRRFLDNAMESALAAAVIHDFSWRTLEICVDEITPVVFSDPLRRVDWLFDHFERTTGSPADSDLAQMLTERVSEWLLSDAPPSATESAEARLRRAKALVSRTGSWEGWLDLDAMEDARATICENLGEDDDGDEV